MCESRVWLPRWAPLRTLLPRPRSASRRQPPARLPLPRALGPATLRRCPTPRRLVPVFQAGDAANADFPGSALRTRPFPSSFPRKQLPASELDCPADFLGCRVGSPGYLPPLPAPRSPTCSQCFLPALGLRRNWAGSVGQPPHLTPLQVSFSLSLSLSVGIWAKLGSKQACCTHRMLSPKHPAHCPNTHGHSQSVHQLLEMASPLLLGRQHAWGVSQLQALTCGLFTLALGWPPCVSSSAQL